MSAARTLLVLLFVVVSARLAEVPRQYVSSQPGGWWDEQPAATLPTEAPADLSRAEDGAENEALPDEAALEVAVKAPSAVRPEDERIDRVPVREPVTLPSDARAPLAAETRGPASTPSVEPASAADVARAEPAPELSTPTAVAAPLRSRTGVVTAHAETVYYEIEGLSRAEISAALRTHGPSVHGQQFFGLTEWEMGVEYQPVEVEAGCAIDDLTVHVSTETRLPRWPSDAVASAALSEAWDRFIIALDAHEDGHRIYAEEAAETVRLRLLDIEAATCDRLDSAARRVMTTVMREYETLQRAYDAETGHGRTQGAVWPPPAGHVTAHQGR